MITIENLEWFDSYGNTYFSAEAYLNGERIMTMPMQYGYSEHCRQVFDQALRKHFEIDQKSSVREMLNKNGIKISVSTSQVKKRDLFKGGAFEYFSPFYKPENLALYAAHRFRNNIPVIEGKTAKFIGHCHVIFNDGNDILFTSVNWF